MIIRIVICLKKTMQYCNLTLHWNVNTVLISYGTYPFMWTVHSALCWPNVGTTGTLIDTPCHAGSSIFKAAPAHLGMNLEPVFDFRSSTDSRTRWETRTGSASQTSSPCRWRNGWPRFTGCNCPAASTPPPWGGSPPSLPDLNFPLPIPSEMFSFTL